MLQTQVLRVGQVNKSCIRLTQVNSIENSVQDCLPYILKPIVYAALLLAYPKQLCVCLKVNMCLIILYDIILPKPFTLFQGDMWLCNCDSNVVMWLMWQFVTVWQWCHINPDPKFPK